MKKRGFLLGFFLVLIILILAFVVKGKEITGEAVTGEIITGEAATGKVTEQDLTLNLTVSDSNNYPILSFINFSIFICESQFLNYEFNVTDLDGDNLTITISPEDPFFIDPSIFETGATNVISYIISGNLDKDDLNGVDTGNKTYIQNISVVDAEGGLDSVNTNITIIEINNVPTLEDIGVQTVWNVGDSIFTKLIGYDDVEYNLNYGSLNFNYTIINSSGDEVDFFNMSSGGLINFSAADEPVGVYGVTICINDTGITNAHPNISDFCDQTGNTNTVCDEFSLTITDENRGPNITSYYPVNLSFSEIGSNTINFNISKHDPDGTIPDAYWYVDGSFVEKDSGSSVDTFSYLFGCDVSGAHNVSVDITDGLLNDSIQWNITTTECISLSPPEGGGVGGEEGDSSKNFSIDPKEIHVKLNQGQSEVKSLTITNNENYTIFFNISTPSFLSFISFSEEDFELGAGEQKTIVVEFTSQESTLPDLYLGYILVEGEGTKKKVQTSVEIESKGTSLEVSVKISEDSFPLIPGKSFVAEITVVNLKKEEMDLSLEYLMMDERGNKVFLESEEGAVRGVLNLLKTFNVPKNTLEGKYVLYVRAIQGDEVGSSSVWFRLSPDEGFRLDFIYILGGLIIILVFIVILFVKKRRKARGTASQRSSAFRPERE